MTMAIDAALYGVFQFPNITRPAVIHHGRHGFGGKTGKQLQFELTRHAHGKVFGQWQNIFPAAAQRRQGDHIERQTVEQIGSKLAGFRQTG